MIIENNLGAFEIETRLPEVPASGQSPNPVPFSPQEPVPFGYLAPGCLGRFHRSGLEKPIVDDAKYRVGDPFKEIKHLVGTVRGGMFGGLGAFAVDWHREGNGVVEFDQRRVSNGPPFSSFWHKWMDNRLIQGAYRVESWSRPIYAKEIAAFAVRTYFKDAVGHCFIVTHRHHFRRDAYAVEISVRFDYEGKERCWIKEPRLVSVLDMMGHAIYVLSNDRAHRYDLRGLLDPAKTTLTIGPTANSPENRYPRYGVRFHGLDLTFQGQAWENTSFGGGMRHAHLKRGNPKGIPNLGRGAVALGDFNSHSLSDPPSIRITPDGGLTGAHQKRLVLKDNWEITKHEGLSTCSVAMHSWPASISKYDYAGGFRRVRKNEEFHVTLRLAKEHFHA